MTYNQGFVDGLTSTDNKQRELEKRVEKLELLVDLLLYNHRMDLNEQVLKIKKGK
jgi:hypothetical protein